MIYSVEAPCQNGCTLFASPCDLMVIVPVPGVETGQVTFNAL